MNLKRVFLGCVIASLSIAALAGISIFLLGTFGDTEMKILLTTLFLGLYSLTALCCTMLYERKRAAPIPLIGLIASGAALLTALLVTWDATFSDETLIKIALVLGILAFSFAHVCLLLLPKVTSKAVDVLRNVTFASITCVAAMLIFLIATEFRAIDDLFIRLLGVFAILDALGTVLLPIALKMSASKR